MPVCARQSVKVRMTGPIHLLDQSPVCPPSHLALSLSQPAQRGSWSFCFSLVAVVLPSCRNPVPNAAGAEVIRVLVPPTPPPRLLVFQTVRRLGGAVFCMRANRAIARRVDATLFFLGGGGEGRGGRETKQASTRLD